MSRKIRYFTLLIISSILLVFCNNKSKVELPQKEVIKVLPPTIDQIIEEGIPKDNSLLMNETSYETKPYKIINGIVQPGQAISQILDNYSIGHSDIYKLEQASKDIFDLRNIQSGKKYNLICSNDSNSVAQCFIYQKSKIEYIVFDFRDTISVRRIEKEVTLKTNIVSGTIQKGGGLWYSISKKLGEEKAPPLVDVLANNIYGWSIDFFQIQENDSFIVYFEEKYVDEEYVGIGKVFATSFTHKGKTINAFRFQENKNFVDYFDERGNNLRSAFLKSPIDFARVSSSFGKRKHPISGRWKEHKGTDYAARTGTQIMTTASGTVIQCKRKGGYGNCIIIKHNEKYSTLYAHLSNYKKGIKKGSYVKQGDVIGYVGSTGYATGPHLHYELMVYGNQVDPYKQELPPSLPLKKENMQDFNNIRDLYMNSIDKFVK